MSESLLPAGWEPFAGLSGLATAITYVAYFATFIVRGVLGFGSGIFAVVVTAWVMPPHHAVLLLLTAILASQVQFLPDGLRHADWNVARPVLGYVVAGVVVGVWIFGRVDAPTLTLLIGLCVTALVIIDTTGLLPRMSRRIDIRGHAPAAVLASTTGLVAGTTGTGGMFFIALYLKLACATAVRLRATAIVIASVSTIWRFMALLVAGFITPSLFTETLLLAPVIFTGGWVGTRYFRTLSEVRFHRFLQVFLLIGAASLVWRAAAQLLAP